MIGLILKDFLNLKKSIRIFVVLAIVYGFMAFTTDSVGFFGTVFTMLFAVLTLSLYAYDDMAKWDVFALTMPISKENIVQGKYIMLLFLTLFGFIVGTAYSFIASIAAKNTDDLINNLQSNGAVVGIAILFFTIIIPFIYKFGVEKARIIFIAVYMIPFIIFYLINDAVKTGKFEFSSGLLEFLGVFEKNAYVIIPLLAFFALYVSYTISVNIYKKKEF